MTNRHCFSDFVLGLTTPCPEEVGHVSRELIGLCVKTSTYVVQPAKSALYSNYSDP